MSLNEYLLVLYTAFLIQKEYKMEPEVRRHPEIEKQEHIIGKVKEKRKKENLLLGVLWLSVVMFWIRASVFEEATS